MILSEKKKQLIQVTEQKEKFLSSVFCVEGGVLSEGSKLQGRLTDLGEKALAGLKRDFDAALVGGDEETEEERVFRVQLMEIHRCWNSWRGPFKGAT